jgi:hypothetical protein
MDMSSDFIRISEHRIRKDDIASYGIARQGAPSTSATSKSAPTTSTSTSTSAPAATRYLYIHTPQQSFRFSDEELDLSDTLTLLDRLLLGGR